MVKNIDKNTNKNIEIVGKDTGEIKVEAVGYKVSYFIFSIFVSMIVIFFYHQGFLPIDIITIPILTLVIYFLMVYFAEIQSRKSKEEFITEKYISHNESIPSVQDIMEQLQGSSENDGPQTQVDVPVPPQTSVLPPPVSPQTSVLPPPVPPQTSTQLSVDTSLGEESQLTNPPSQEENPNPYPQPYPIYPQKSKVSLPSEEEVQEVIMEVVGEEVSSDGKKQQFIDQKQKQIALMQKRKVPNLTNQSDQSLQPININVSYNNNRPLSINDFPSGKISLDDLKRKSNENNYTFDPGLTGQYSQKLKNTINTNTNTNTNIDNRQDLNNTNLQMPINSFLPSAKKKTVSSPVNNFTENLALADMNQGYYPQYLENPLNKDKNPTNILNILEESKSNKLNDIYSENNNDTVVNPEKWKNFFLGNEAKDTICSQNQNTPCPVLLNNYWSEYKPIDDSS